jgi:hypothetical protein
MNECNFFVVGDEANVNGVVGFEKTVIEKCEFDCVTFVLSKNAARAMRADLTARGKEIKFIGAPLN